MQKAVTSLEMLAFRRRSLGVLLPVALLEMAVSAPPVSAQSEANWISTNHLAHSSLVPGNDSAKSAANTDFIVASEAFQGEEGETLQGNSNNYSSLTLSKLSGSVDKPTTEPTDKPLASSTALVAFDDLVDAELAGVEFFESTPEVLEDAVDGFAQPPIESSENEQFEDLHSDGFSTSSVPLSTAPFPSQSLVIESDRTHPSAAENFVAVSDLVDETSTDAESRSVLFQIDEVSQSPAQQELPEDENRFGVPESEQDRPGNEAPADFMPVHELLDVAPDDWAFQALQNLVEQHGCLAGYPDGTFRGDQALSRYEFATVLDVCMNVIVEQTGDAAAAEEDLRVLQQLQQDFADEIISVEDQVTRLENEVATLRQQQTSPVLKLSGFAWMDINAATFAGGLKRETGFRVSPGSSERFIETIDEEPAPIFTGYVWLDLNASFTGSDRLLLQLAAGTGTPILNNVVSAGLEYTYGANFTNQPGGVEPFEFVIRQLSYQFPVGDRLSFVVGPRMNVYDYFEYNPYHYYFFDNGPAFNFTSFNSANSTLFAPFDRGGGAIAMWQISDQLELKAAYLAANNEFLPGFLSPLSNSDEGIFGGTNSLMAELTYRPSPTVGIRLLYNRARLDAVNGNIGRFGDGEPVLGIIDDGFGGFIDDTVADVFAIGAHWEVSREFGFFGQYSYGSLDVSPLDPDIPGGDIRVQAYQLGVAFPHLFKENALGMISFVVPQDYLEGREFLVSGGGDGGTQTEWEISYYYPVNDHISLLPSIYIINNPNNFSDNPTIFVFNLRTELRF